MAEPENPRPRRSPRPKLVDLTAVRAAASVFAERLAFATRAGLTYEGTRDLYEAFGYAKVLRPEHYRARFERGGLAKRIVTVYPKATWRGGGELIEDGDPQEKTKFERAWADLDKRLGIWPTLERADILARLGRYSILLIGAPGSPEEELPKGLGPEGIVYLAPYGELHVTINANDLETDPASPRWGLPLRYEFSALGQQDAPNGVSAYAVPSAKFAKIHWSRVIHIAEAPLENPLYGEPALADVWNYLDDLDKVEGGGAEAFFVRAHPGLQLDLDPTLPLDAGALTALQEQVSDYLHNYRRTLQTRGVEVNQLSASVAPVAEHIKAIEGLIAATKGIPQRVLIGSERGDLASSQDDAEWREKVQDRRGSFAEAVVLRPLVERLITFGALPDTGDGEFEVRWPEWRDLSIEERIDLAGKLAAVNKDHATARPGEIVVTVDEIRERTLDLDPLEDVAPEEVLDGTDAEGTPGVPEEEGANVRPFAAARYGRRRHRGNGSTRSPIDGSGRSEP